MLFKCHIQGQNILFSEEKKMFLVRKNRINSLIRKEQNKVRTACEKESERKLQALRKELESIRIKQVREMEREHKQVLLKKDREIARLKKEIEKNYSKYLELRNRERELEDITSEMEDTAERMVIKIQENLQPLYRTRSKVLTAKRKSDREHEKIESIFSAVK